MTISCNAVFQQTDIMTIVKAMRRLYGGSNYTIRLTDQDDHVVVHFDEELTPAQVAGNATKMYHRRKRGESRMMHVFLNGYCACDYREVFSRDPGVLLSLGSHGDAERILNLLTAHFGGGWIKDEGNSKHPDSWYHVLAGAEAA
ncbi:hypothetical protein HOU00_gp203 [Caulobacter phage CcrPW]|uniref:Uncharacterized protein n=1 Tax=Caulobacter phage CcrPW TaxID=2283271 RepID=A0A385EDJ0_9CAUD|nr:hypothetical protein HOU00_gp203 [Caulobacter phage CcrPW]AXQ68922.1 hypothetical protein CcrPW_gp383c [Caulobacter phage CcrPW]